MVNGNCATRSDYRQRVFLVLLVTSQRRSACSQPRADLSQHHTVQFSSLRQPYGVFSEPSGLFGIPKRSAASRNCYGRGPAAILPRVGDEARSHRLLGSELAQNLPSLAPLRPFLTATLSYCAPCSSNRKRKRARGPCVRSGRDLSAFADRASLRTEGAGSQSARELTLAAGLAARNPADRRPVQTVSWRTLASERLRGLNSIRGASSSGYLLVAALRLDDLR